jgi:hypothetical protein
MSNRPNDALKGDERRGAFFVVPLGPTSESGDAQGNDVAAEDLLRRLVPFDVIGRYREAYRRCRYNYL